MAGKWDRGVDGRVLGLSEAGFTYRQIQKVLQDNGHKRSLGYISNVVNCKGKNRLALARNEIHRRSRQDKIRTAKFALSVSKLVLKSEPMTQAAIARRKRCSTATISRTIRQDLGLIAKKKPRHPYLTEAEKANRKTNSRKLYENLAGHRSEYAVSIDEALIYFHPGNQKTQIFYGKRGEDAPDECIIANKHQFPQKFMIIAGITGRVHSKCLKCQQIQK